MANKTTKREYFDIIRDIVSDNPELVNFIDHEIELLDKKSSTPRKPTANQTENETFKALILEYLATVDAPVRLSVIQTNIPELAGLSNQRITHLMTALVNDNKVVKSYTKKVVHYTIAC